MFEAIIPLALYQVVCRKKVGNVHKFKLHTDLDTD